MRECVTNDKKSNYQKKLVRIICILISLFVECFVERCDPDKMKNRTEVVNNCQTNQYIFDLQSCTENFDKCLNESDANGGDNCKNCLMAFNTLEGHFHRFERGGICFESVQVGL